MPASVGNANIFKPYYADDESTTPNVVFEQATLGTAISHPYSRYYRVVSGFMFNSNLGNWCDAHYANLWHAALTTQDSKNGLIASWFYHGKTIYDPSPVGYELPPRYTFSGFAGGPAGDNPKTFVDETENNPSGMLYEPTGLFIPFAGQIGNVTTGEDGLNLDFVNVTGYYWLNGDYNGASFGDQMFVQALDGSSGKSIYMNVCGAQGVTTMPKEVAQSVRSIVDPNF